MRAGWADEQGAVFVSEFAVAFGAVGEIAH